MNYRLGDVIEWGTRYDVGVPGKRRVLVEGSAWACDYCRKTKFETFDCVVTFENDRIVAVELCPEELPDFGDEGYIIVED